MPTRMIVSPDCSFTRMRHPRHIDALCQLNDFRPRGFRTVERDGPFRCNNFFTPQNFEIV
jgi:hypothetical protein